MPLAALTKLELRALPNAAMMVVGVFLQVVR